MKVVRAYEIVETIEHSNCVKVKVRHTADNGEVSEEVFGFRPDQVNTGHWKKALEKWVDALESGGKKLNATARNELKPRKVVLEAKTPSVV